MLRINHRIEKSNNKPGITFEKLVTKSALKWDNLSVYKILIAKNVQINILIDVTAGFENLHESTVLVVFSYYIWIEFRRVGNEEIEFFIVLIFDELGDLIQKSIVILF